MTALTTPARPARVGGVLAALLTVLLVTGCSPSDAGQPLPTDLRREVGTPSVPDPGEEPLPESATEEETIIAMLRFELETGVLEQAAVKGEVSSACTAVTDREFDCVVTFEGHDVNHKVNVTDVSEPSSVMGQRIAYEVVEQQVVLTRQAVLLGMQDTMAGSAKNGNEYTDPRCDEFPEVQVLADGEELEEPNCYATDAEWPNLTEKFYVSVNSVGPNLFHR